MQALKSWHHGRQERKADGSSKAVCNLCRNLRAPNGSTTFGISIQLLYKSSNSRTCRYCAFLRQVINYFVVNAVGNRKYLVVQIMAAAPIVLILDSEGQDSGLTG